MTVAEQVASRNALVQLRTNTLAFLTNTRFTVGLPPGGVDTTDESLCFAFGNGQAILSSAGQAGVTCGAGTVLHNIDVHATPMRTAGLGVGRTAATARILPGAGSDLWVTVRQTGCSVLILDWGGSVSMVHLQPSLVQDFRWRAVRGLLALSNYTNRETHRYSLQGELMQVVTATRGMGPAPLRYILVQSNWTIASGHYLGVTGIRTGNAWDFFLQEYTLAAVIAARQLNWTARHRFGVFTASAY